MRNDKWFLGVLGAFIFSLLCNALSINSFLGVPAHPLLLHMPVIFIPVLAIATLVFIFRPDWRKVYGIAWGFGAMLTTAATTVAAGAGEAWEGKLDPRAQLLIHDHTELGDKLKVLVVLFAALVLVQLALDRGIPQSLAARFANPRSGPSVALAVVLGVVAIGAGALTFATGHEGAKAVFGHGGINSPGDLPGQQP